MKRIRHIRISILSTEVNIYYHDSLYLKFALNKVPQTDVLS